MSRINKISSSLTLGALALVGFVACGSDKSNSAGVPNTGGGDGQAATGGVKGTGGTAAASGGASSGGASVLGAGGALGTGGTSDADAKAPLECGGVVCAPKYTPACCTGAGTGVPGNKLELGGRAAGLCGTDLSQYSASLAGICLQLNQPGVLDPSCPDTANPNASGPSLKGCCTDQGYCGAYEGTLALGCEYPGKRGKACGKSGDAGADAKAGDASKN
jgi:hypothetical protein